MGCSAVLRLASKIFLDTSSKSTSTEVGRVLPHTIYGSASNRYIVTWVSLNRTSCVTACPRAAGVVGSHCKSPRWMLLGRDGDFGLIRSHLICGCKFDLQRYDLQTILASLRSCDLLPTYRASGIRFAIFLLLLLPSDKRFH